MNRSLALLISGIFFATTAACWLIGSSALQIIAGISAIGAFALLVVAFAAPRALTEARSEGEVNPWRKAIGPHLHGMVVDLGGPLRLERHPLLKGAISGDILSIDHQSDPLARLCQFTLPDGTRGIIVKVDDDPTHRTRAFDSMERHIVAARRSALRGGVVTVNASKFIEDPISAASTVIGAFNLVRQRLLGSAESPLQPLRVALVVDVSNFALGKLLAAVAGDGLLSVRFPFDPERKALDMSARQDAQLAHLDQVFNSSRLRLLSETRRVVASEISSVTGAGGDGESIIKFRRCMRIMTEVESELGSLRVGLAKVLSPGVSLPVDIMEISFCSQLDANAKADAGNAERWQYVFQALDVREGVSILRDLVARPPGAMQDEYSKAIARIRGLKMIDAGAALVWLAVAIFAIVRSVVEYPRIRNARALVEAASAAARAPRPRSGPLSTSDLERLRELDRLRLGGLNAASEGSLLHGWPVTIWFSRLRGDADRVYAELLCKSVMQRLAPYPGERDWRTRWNNADLNVDDLRRWLRQNPLSTGRDFGLDSFQGSDGRGCNLLEAPASSTPPANPDGNSRPIPGHGSQPNQADDCLRVRALRQPQFDQLRGVFSSFPLDPYAVLDADPYALQLLLDTRNGLWPRGQRLRDAVAREAGRCQVAGYEPSTWPVLSDRVDQLKRFLDFDPVRALLIVRVCLDDGAHGTALSLSLDDRIIPPNAAIEGCRPGWSAYEIATWMDTRVALHRNTTRPQELIASGPWGFFRLLRVGRHTTGPQDPYQTVTWTDENRNAVTLNYQWLCPVQGRPRGRTLAPDGAVTRYEACSAGGLSLMRFPIAVDAGVSRGDAGVAVRPNEGVQVQFRGCGLLHLTTCSTSAPCDPSLLACTQGDTARCIDPLSDDANCGGCARVQPLDSGRQRCVGGQFLACGGADQVPCAAAPRCQAPMLECGGSCIDVSRSRNHCGACNISCGDNTSGCIGGQCACMPEFRDCNGTPDDGCEVAVTSRRYCGSCDVSCADGQECVSRDDGAAACSAPLDATADIPDSLTDALELTAADVP